MRVRGFNLEEIVPNPRLRAKLELDKKKLLKELRYWGISDERVLRAFEVVPRELFLPDELKASAYENVPLPIGNGQTTSQPLMIAIMLEALELRPSDRVLEIGTGAGYQTALLAELVKEVFTVEVIEEFYRRACELLGRYYDNVRCKLGDGYWGWSE